MDRQDGKYQRQGYVPGNLPRDLLLTAFLQEIPGDNYLPVRWRYGSRSQFVSDYGHLGILLWSASHSSHLLLVNGHHAVRIWTDAKGHCWVDALGHLFCYGLYPQPIPKGNARKSKPFKFRTKITTTKEISALAKNVKAVYGI